MLQTPRILQFFHLYKEFENNLPFSSSSIGPGGGAKAICAQKNPLNISTRDYWKSLAACSVIQGTGKVECEDGLRIGNYLKALNGLQRVHTIPGVWSGAVPTPRFLQGQTEFQSSWVCVAPWCQSRRWVWFPIGAYLIVKGILREIILLVQVRLFGKTGLISNYISFCSQLSIHYSLVKDALFQKNPEYHTNQSF